MVTRNLASITLRAALAFAALTSVASAQLPRRIAPVDSAARTDPRSPRAALGEFLALTRRGQFEAAGQFMGSGVSTARAAELAQRLKAVFDQRLWIDLEDVSPLATGDTLDGLRDDREQIGMIANEIGVRQPVQMERMRSGDPAWVFDPRTVSRIDQWYDALGNRWLRDHMPVTLQRAGPFGIELWQWAMLGFLIPVSLAVGWLLSRTTLGIGRRIARRLQTPLDDHRLAGMAAPLVATWTIVAYRALAELIGLSISASRFADVVTRAFVVVLVTWAVIRATYLLEKEIPASRWAGEKPEMRSLLPLLGRVVRIVLLVLGAIVFVAQFGYSVATLITGLGIGGIAVALAMQKTLEHMFGSVAIGLDQPIRVGDWVKVGETEGEVEAIGLRSTRLRTLERSVVVIPNGRLSEMQMENFGVRDRILLRTNIALAYGTSADQVRRIRDDVDALLTEHPLVWSGRIIVRFKGLGATALDIDVICWMATKDYNVFRAAREEIFFKIMQIVERAGSDFAYPLDKRHI